MDGVNSVCPIFQTAIKKNNPRKFLRSVGDGEVVEFDVIEAAKVRVDPRAKGAFQQSSLEQWACSTKPIHVTLSFILF